MSWLRDQGLGVRALVRAFWDEGVGLSNYGRGLRTRDRALAGLRGLG